MLAGPEAPLVAGLVDSLKQTGIRCLHSPWITYQNSAQGELSTVKRNVRAHIHVIMTGHCSRSVAMCLIASCACRAFGPSAAAAQLEGSKAFLKVTTVLLPLPWMHSMEMLPNSCH